MQIVVQKIENIDEKILKRADAFILSNYTNGEFINSVRYLSYHPKDRFVDDSIIVLNRENNEVLGIMMAAQSLQDANTVVSHPGTTFSGPIVSYKLEIEMVFSVLQVMLEYYESRYKTVEIRLRPTIYDDRPMEYLSFYLLNRGYQYGMTALANVVEIDAVDSLDEQLRVYSAKRRNHVKKAIKEDRYTMLLEESINEECWSHMNINLKEKYGASSTHTYQEIIHLKKLYPEQIQMYTVRRKTGEYGAFSVVYRFKNVFHTQYLDMNYSYSSEYPHLYLIHNLIHIAHNEGYRWFSFGASTEARGKYLNQGLYHYKDGYGGGSIILPVYTKNV